MEPPDTFTYCHSEILLMTDEIKLELAHIHFIVTNLILKIQGNYRALFELSQTRCDLLDNCDLNLQRIRGDIPDSDGDNSLQPGISLTDLSTKEKQLILSMTITSTVAIKVLAGIFDCDFQTSASRLASICELEFGSMSAEAIERAIEEIEKNLKEHPDGASFFMEIER